MIFLLSADFYSKSTFSKNLLGKRSEYQTVWILIRPDILSGLIWVQTVCKGYQQMKKVATSKERVAFLCRLLITFAKSLNQDQARQNADQDANCLILKEFF